MQIPGGPNIYLIDYKLGVKMKITKEEAIRIAVLYAKEKKIPFSENGIEANYVSAYIPIILRPHWAIVLGGLATPYIHGPIIEVDVETGEAVEFTVDF